MTSTPVAFPIVMLPLPRFLTDNQPTNRKERKEGKRCDEPVQGTQYTLSGTDSVPCFGLATLFTSEGTTPMGFGYYPIRPWVIFGGVSRACTQ
jgi:hypothetical protein